MSSKSKKLKRSRSSENAHTRIALHDIVEKCGKHSLNVENTKLLFANMPSWFLKLIFLRSNFKTPLYCQILNNNIDLPAALLKRFKYLRKRSVMSEILKHIRLNVRDLKKHAKKYGVAEKEFPAHVATSSVDKACIDLCFKLGLKFNPLSMSGPIDAITNAMFSQQNISLYSEPDSLSNFFQYTEK